MSLLSMSSCAKLTFLPCEWNKHLLSRTKAIESWASARPAIQYEAQEDFA